MLNDANKAAPGLPPKLRVAMLNQDLWMGGGTVFALNLGGELLRRGVETRVFSFGGAHSMEQDFDRVGLLVHRLNRGGLIFEDRIASLHQPLTDFAPNVIIANESFVTCELLRYVPAGVTRVVVVHTSLPVARKNIVRYVPWIDRIVAVSLPVRDQALATPGIPAHLVAGIELGVAMPAVPPARNFSSGQPLRILYAGRLEEPAKRVRTFPAIFKNLCADGVPFVWTIAGIGPERAWLESEMVSRPNHQVRFTGFVPQGQIGELLASNDVVLLTSDTEAFPLSLHEAMAAGLVPVASDIPGRVREIVTAETGRLVPVDQIDGYAAAIGWLHHHREEMTRMSRASVEMIDGRYTVKAMGDRWLALLKSLVSPPAPKWSKAWDIEPPIVAESCARFQPKWRPVRRVGARLRHYLELTRKIPIFPQPG